MSEKVAMEFGLGLQKDKDSGKIGYQTFSGESLDIVGAGPKAQDREVRVYDRLLVNSDNKDLQPNTQLKVGGNIWAANGDIFATVARVSEVCLGATCFKEDDLKRLLTAPAPPAKQQAPAPAPDTPRAPAPPIPALELPKQQNQQALYEFTSHKFTSCGAIGREGPTLQQCRSSYNTAWINNNDYYNMKTLGIQLWTVPISGFYKIQTAGARGGNATTAKRNGGNGIILSGTFMLSKGSILKIAVGHIGGNNTYTGGGGGGSFVATTIDDKPLIVSGGGGGAGNSGGDGRNAVNSVDGGAGHGGHKGGINGRINKIGSSGGWGQSGGSFYSDGTYKGSEDYERLATALSFINGATGAQGSGVSASCQPTLGGFGGGGSGSCDGGGGGGGYSGGAPGGGGGGSINNGTNNENGGQNNDNGYVQVNFLWSFTSHKFTNCGATGRTGPTIEACRSTYIAAAWSSAGGLLSMSTQGIQLFTIPFTGTYVIRAAGASGGDAHDNALGGRGRILESTFILKQGDIIKILVGQSGSSRKFQTTSGTSAGSGGGGTFVLNPNDQPLIIAGGGGGAINTFDWNQVKANGVDAPFRRLGTNSKGSDSSGNFGAGGKSVEGGAGAGISGDGEGGRGGNNGGIRMSAGGLGGVGTNAPEGGFGGGGGSWANNVARPGAGGGVSGGDTEGIDGPGGAGGSISNGFDIKDVGLNVGHGYVEVALASEVNENFKVNNRDVEGSKDLEYEMQGPNTFSFDFSTSTWSRVKLQLYGAGGGHEKGGRGGYVEGIVELDKIASKRFWVVVGGAGSTKNTTSQGVLYTTGGYNGGGRGVSNNTEGNNTGGGGGATDVRLNFTEVTEYDKAQRILVAGGGGGGTSNSTNDSQGGNAGHPNAPNVVDAGYGGADGGTQNAGGAMGGSLGKGGENTNNNGWNGGGGGGYYGGGACKKLHGAGAGGSGYVDGAFVSSFTKEANGGGSAAQRNGRAILTVIS